jgi:trans-2,3-dihydro-3-hydroxyanthranilate isomerase
MELIVVDVFAERPFAGNQLAVVLDAASLSRAQMQAIALETNFSETTFVTGTAPGTADVRIFTPTSELPFAGHPTLGTAWVLAAGAPEQTLNLAAGAVPVRFEAGVAWMTPPPVRFDEGIGPERAAALLGLPRTALDDAFPIRFAAVGPRFLLVGVEDQNALTSLRIDEGLLAGLSRAGELFSVFAFCRETTDPETDFAARMFFSAAGGLREDPATGSANTAFAAYLQILGEGSGSAVVEQGVAMNRPSRLYLRYADGIEVGGRVQEVLRGRLSCLP